MANLQQPKIRIAAWISTPVPNISVATRQVVSKERVVGCPAGWKGSLNGKNWELTTWFRVTCWRKLADAVNQYLEKGSQVFVEVAMKYLRLLGPLDWQHFPNRPDQRFNPNNPPLSLAPFVGAYLVKIDQRLPHMADLHEYLVYHPSLVWVLGFPLVRPRPFPGALISRPAYRTIAISVVYRNRKHRDPLLRIMVGMGIRSGSEKAEHGRDRVLPSY